MTLSINLSGNLATMFRPGGELRGGWLEKQGEAWLVFGAGKATVTTVVKTFFRRWFSSAAPSSLLETTQALAERGVAEAQFSLGLSYASGKDKGKGAEPDYALAEHWYLKAADQNHAMAQFNLGMMHANGQGMPRDRAKSLVWIQKAADLGDAAAQYRLGRSHQRDIRDGLPEKATESRLNAYKWLRLAADQGYLGAETACETVNMDMSREDVAEGGRRVTAFNDLHPGQQP